MSSDHPSFDPDVSALIGSRICHDLISPIGAIGNGLELLSMAGLGEGPEMSLIAESVANANARIRFFRLAFGQSGRDQATSRAEILSILADLYAASRLNVVWSVPADCSRAEAKAGFLALQCLESAMPFGGSIEVTRQDGTWQVAGTSEKLRVEDTLWALLEHPGGAAELAPAQVQFAVLPETVAQLGRRLRVSITPEAIRLSY